MWNDLALVHAMEGHPLLLRQHGKRNGTGGYVDAAFFFIDPKTGVRFSDDAYRAMFKGAMLELLGVAFPPKLCRNILATELLSGDSVAGFSVEGAANLMGNSAPTLKLHYDKAYHHRQGQLALEGMQAWMSDVQRAGNEAEASSDVEVVESESIEVCLSEEPSYYSALSHE